MTQCVCGSGVPEPACCDRFHRGIASAPTAEALMRSRFAAYARQNEAYLRRTWHSSTRPRHIGFADSLRWVRLEILDRTGGGLLDRQRQTFGNNLDRRDDAERTAVGQADGDDARLEGWRMPRCEGAYQWPAGPGHRPR